MIALRSISVFCRPLDGHTQRQAAFLCLISASISRGVAKPWLRELPALLAQCRGASCGN